MFIKYILPAAALCAVLPGCTKKQPDYPYTDLLQFSVQDAAGQPLKGVVGNSEIILYWPPHQMVPDSITVNITAAERASISPASGSKVPFDEKTVFTVTAQNGSQQQYRLKPVINQPPPQIIRTSPADVLTYGDLLTISGNHFIPDSAQTRAYLVDKNNNETPLIFWSPYPNVVTVGEGILWCQVPEPVKDTLPSLPYGEYHIKVVSGIRTAYSTARLTIGFQIPSVSAILPSASVRRGNEVTFKGGKFIGITSVKGQNSESGKEYEFELSGYSMNELKLKVPATVPPGTYFQFAVTSDAYGKETVNFWLYDEILTVAE